MYKTVGQKMKSGTTEKEIDISQLTKGIYFIRLENNNLYTLRKIIKN